ncbi:MAG: crossover junction endodeoxyribonuclease RuvC [Chlamydiae bacterium]|nr:crossover junction endodeoxyribonuclease RuvC [Chlamydiota bacterium]MBI3267142.1 crossover junction endodeoxyribonuclease RuvC [Chlamydiota bacterium]
MRILGIDPGSLKTGFGVIEVLRGSFKLVDCGYISNSSKSPLPRRFLKIFSELNNVIDRSSPDCAAIETLFYFKNPRTAFKLGEARGVAVLAAAHHQLEIHEYEPRRIKQAVIGFGSAHKFQIKKMVSSLLGLKTIEGPEDVTDALAVAICHAHHLKAEVRRQ